MYRQFRIKATGVMTPKGIEKFQKKLKKEMKSGMGEAMKEAAVYTKGQLGSDIKSALNVKKEFFAKAIRYRVHNKKPGRMPLFELHSSIWWMSAHEGKSIISRRAKYMMIPIQNLKGSRRVKRKDFIKKLEELRKSKDTFFRKNKKGKLIMFAVLNKNNRGKLRQFTSILRNQTGRKKLSYGTAVPIAVLQPMVILKRRINIPNRAEVHFMPMMKRLFNSKVSL